ncbi:MAG: TetR family transcriptional regulator [Xanthomonadales bacterium]|nr:TetR family transcriptional regulator [Xanthomonadales bacterium]
MTQIEGGPDLLGVRLGRKKSEAPSDVESATRGETPRRRFGREEALRAARRLWSSGDRIDMGRLAEHLGLARATLFRWFGSRDGLLAEVLWSLCDATLKEAERLHPSSTPAAIVARCDASVRALAGFEPLRRFIAEDSERALRMLTSSASPLQSRTVARLQEWIDQASGKAWKPDIDADTLAYLLVRMGESFLYARAISGRSVALSDCTTAFELLLSVRGGAPDRRARRGGER